MAAMVEIAIVVDYFDDNNGVCVESVDSKAVEHDRLDVCVGDVDTQLISPAETHKRWNKAFKNDLVSRCLKQQRIAWFL